MHNVLVVDTETDGLLDTLTKFHSLVLRDPDTGKVFSYTDNVSGKRPRISDGIKKMADAKVLVAHNGIKFDEHVIEKFYPGTLAAFAKKGVIWRDTIVLARLIWPEIKQDDFRLINGKNPNFPRKLIGSQSLEAWGHRLGFPKTGLDVSFDRWSEELQQRCEQDTLVTVKLWQKIVARRPSRESVEIEHEFARIIYEQERNGYPFDESGAQKLYIELAARRQEIEDKLHETKTFRPMWLPDGKQKVPPKTLNFKSKERASLVAGAAYQPVELTVFNPGSRDHVALWLKKRYGWKPKDFTNDGKPKIDEKVLASLKYPEAPTLKEHFLIAKRIGQIAEGKQAWLKAVKNGVIYGRVNTNGAVTGRCTHSHPNVSQVPAAKSAYGKECRSLWRPFPGEKQVGVDAAGLELRCLGHYLYQFDGGVWAKSVVEGTKDEGTDVHTLNAVALGLDPKGIYVVNGKQTTGRDLAKTFIYATLYGAGIPKIAKILGLKLKDAKERKFSFLEKMGIGKLLRAVKRKVNVRGYLIGIDGRRLTIRSDHAALNTLLQSAGGIVMKKADIVMWQHFRKLKLPVRQLAHIHDEVQLSVKPRFAEKVGALAAKAITEAGEAMGFRCPLAGEYSIGDNWYDTH